MLPVTVAPDMMPEVWPPTMTESLGPKATVLAWSAPAEPKRWVHSGTPVGSKTWTKLSLVDGSVPLRLAESVVEKLPSILVVVVPILSAPVTEPATATEPSAATAIDMPDAVSAAPNVRV